MKRIIVLILFFALGFSYFYFSQAETGRIERSREILEEEEALRKRLEITEKSSVVVYYFYTSLRCPSCHRIEKYTKEALEQYFGEELKSGRLVFKAVNVEKKENNHFIKDYELYTKSVVISLVKEGKEEKYSNLSKVWIYLGDKQQFYDYIKAEVEGYLKELNE